MLNALLLIAEDAERDLLSGYTDHDSYVAACAIQALCNAIRHAIRIEAQRGETRSGSISEADESLTAESGDAQTAHPIQPRERK